jgi:anti-anti-sigma factor
VSTLGGSLDGAYRTVGQSPPLAFPVTRGDPKLYHQQQRRRPPKSAMTGPHPEISDRPPSPFSVAVSGGGDHPLLAAVAGDVDIATANSMSQAVIAALDDAPGSGVVLDFTNVGFMDSSGLRAVLDIARRLDMGTASLVLLSPNRPVRKLLSLAGLDERMPIATTLEDAEAILAQRKA